MEERHSIIKNIHLEKEYFERIEDEKIYEKNL